MCVLGSGYVKTPRVIHKTTLKEVQWMEGKAEITEQADRIKMINMERWSLREETPVECAMYKRAYNVNALNISTRFLT
jgi:hypothetical protein